MEGRICGPHIDACRAVVKAAAESMEGPGADDSLFPVLHQVVSELLNQELRYLKFHDPNPGLISPEFHREIGDRKGKLILNDFTGIVQLRASQWAGALIELMARLTSDWELLVSFFRLDPNAAVVSISEPLGDPHHDGRSVYKIGFADGRALIYKPRPVDTESAFGEIVEWLQGNGCDMGLKWCRALPRGDYGWTEFVYAAPCQTAEEAERFYVRQGAFLALFFLIRGSDCIAENFIGVGEHPVWVDVECICRPEFAEPVELPSKLTSVPWVQRSVLSTALMYYPNLEGFDPHRFTALQASCLEDRNEVFTPKGIMRSRYVGAVQHGFGQLYSCALGHRDAWKPGGPVYEALSSVRVRVLPRPTTLYSILASWNWIAPTAGSDDVRRSIANALGSEEARLPWFSRLTPIELDVLMRADIPHWTIATDSLDLMEASGAQVPGLAWRSGQAALAASVSDMNPHDLQTQLWLIDGFLNLRPLTGSAWV